MREGVERREEMMIRRQRDSEREKGRERLQTRQDSWIQTKQGL